ncbi:MAG: hypothetical protein KDC18_12245 [Alphaproteobacteria bacterium]|nr:hypothetical protein [Alphaproteobacteria bacterium]MCB9931725.1 hypothetical protein [Alphaproteobacteria bacterium]
MSLIGGFSARLETTKQIVDLPSRKSRALLIVLALSPDWRATRERISGLLWPEASPSHAQGSLRREVWALRAQFGSVGLMPLVTSRTHLALDPFVCRIDVNELFDLDQLRANDASPLLTRRYFIDEIAFGFEDILSDWIYVRRQDLQNQLLERLTRALEQPETASDPRMCLRLARVILNIDPTNESACRMVMRNYAKLGNRAGAMRAYSELWSALDEAYDEEPSARTQELYIKIKTQPSGPDALLALPAEPVAANRSAEAEGIALTIFCSNQAEPGLPARENRISNGLRQEFLAGLSKFREWRIVTGPQEPSEAPPTAYTLDMSITVDQDDAFIAFNLVEGFSSELIWGESISCKTTNWSNIQQRIVRKIAIALNLNIISDRIFRARQKEDLDLDSYDRWLRGEELFFTYNGANWQRAEQLFETISPGSPMYGRAQSSLAQLENSRHLVFPGLRRTPYTTALALERSDRAVQFDPLDSRAQLCRAWSLAMSAAFDRAEIGYEAALSLNGNDPWTQVSSALGLAFVGRESEAMRLIRRFLENPAASPVHLGYLATAYFMCGAYADCVAATTAADDAIQNLPAWRAAALALLGETAPAAAIAAEYVHQTAGNWHANVAPTSEAVADWLLHCFPIRNQTRWAQLRDGLAMAGLPIVADGSLSAPTGASTPIDADRGPTN